MQRPHGPMEGQHLISIIEVQLQKDLERAEEHLPTDFKWAKGQLARGLGL